MAATEHRPQWVFSEQQCALPPPLKWALEPLLPVGLVPEPSDIVT